LKGETEQQESGVGKTIVPLAYIISTYLFYFFLKLMNEENK
jgi:hypothetical protein